MIVNQFMKLLIVKQILLVICHGKCQENSVEGQLITQLSHFEGNVLK